MPALITALIIAAVIILFLHAQNSILDLTRYAQESKDANDEIKIVQLSDLHSRPFKKALSAVEKEKPDIIAVTGDFINDRCKNRNKMLEYAKKLSEFAPCFYITGNHERRLECFDELMQQLGESGFRVLLDETATIKIKNTFVNILGLDENQADFDDYKARKNGTFVYRDSSPYFEELSKKQGYKLVLCHFPENFEAVKENNYSQYDFDLQLSGHAHGGQFILPFIGPVYSPGQGLMPKYARGSFGTRPMMIVSRGLGNAEFPFRLFNHPEITITTVVPKK